MRIMDTPLDQIVEGQRDVRDWIRGELMLIGGPPGSRDRMAKDAATRPKVARLLLKGLTSGDALTVDEASASRSFGSIVARRSILEGATRAGLLRPMPLNTTSVLVVRAAQGAAVEAKKAKPVSQLQLAGAFAAVRKTCTIVVATREVVANPKAEGLLIGGLAAGEASANNAEIVSIIKANTSLTVSAEADDFLPKGFGAFTASYPTSRFFMIVSTQVARSLAGAMGSAGLLYPSFDAGAGGQIGMMQAFIDDSLADGEALLVDGDGFGADAGEVKFDFSNQAALQFDDAPTHDVETPASLVTLWQSNSTAALAERSFSFEPLRDDAAVLITGIGTTP